MGSGAAGGAGATTPDRVVPGERWAFDAEVTAAFDDMLARSIPQYPVMRELVTELAVSHALPGSAVVDLGCSRGEALAPIVERVRNRGCSFIGVEVSEPMVAAAKERFVGRNDVWIERLDLRHEYPSRVPASVTLAVLTMQFVPLEHRLRVMRDAFRNTIPGGVVILVEKVLGGTADLDREFVRQYLDLKRAHGYSEEQIQRKRMALEGVLVPVTAAWNEDMLRRSGFTEVDCFWRWLNFAGWVGVRPV